MKTELICDALMDYLIMLSDVIEVRELDVIFDCSRHEAARKPYHLLLDYGMIDPYGDDQDIRYAISKHWLAIRGIDYESVAGMIA